MSWTIDPAHTRIGFSVKHMMVSTVRGAFQKYEATLDLHPEDFTKSSFSADIDVASIDTGNEQRDNHLRTNDFFNAQQFPKMRFKSTRIEKKGDDYVVHGDLTIRDVTKAVALDVEFGGTAKGMQGRTIAGLTASTTVNRKDFGVNFNALLEAGGMVVSDKVKIELEVEAWSA